MLLDSLTHILNPLLYCTFHLVAQHVMGPTEDSSNASIKVKSYSIPRLATDRSNWITWKQQTLSSLVRNYSLLRLTTGHKLLSLVVRYDGVARL